MKTAAFIAVASAAVASAQLSYDNTTNTFSCPKPGQAYCAGTSLGTDIIIRCDATGKGQPGRCTDNLAGSPPLGVNPALCWQTSETSGDAACEKNCVVYGGSGNYNGTFTLPADQCTPYYTATSTTQSSTAGPTGTGTGTTSCASTTLTTVTSSASTTICPTVTPPTGTGGGSGGSSVVPPPNNGTTTTIITPPTNGPTRTPVGPTTSSSGPSGVATAGAVANRVGGALAAIGFVAAYML